MMFVQFNANPINRNTGDCVVRGVSVLMNQSWRDTYADLAMVAYYLSDMPASNHAWGEYLILNGYRRHAIPDTCPRCYTVREFCLDHPKGRFLVCTGSHVVAVIDGDYYDTWDSTSGVPEQLREFSFDEKTPAPVAQGGVTREEFDSLSKKIDKLINDLGGASNG